MDLNSEITEPASDIHYKNTIYQMLSQERGRVIEKRRGTRNNSLRLCISAVSKKYIFEEYI